MMLSVLMTSVLTSLVMSPALCQRTESHCEVYEAELRSRPDFSHRVMTSSLALPPDYVITSVKQDVSRGRSFYWCEMRMKEKGMVKVLRHYGYNDTVWWVSKGCGGWFTITACRRNDTSSSSFTTTTPNPNGDNVDPYATPVVVTVISANGTDARKEGSQAGALTHVYSPLHENDINVGELRSLYQWLQELYTPIHEKLGGDPHRVARSVNEEFKAEFGY